MDDKRHRWWMGLVIVALLAPGTARAGPYFGDWGWCWKSGKDCPKGCYSPCHYWAPTAYWVKYSCWPAHIYQAPPGLPVPVGWLLNPSRCRAVFPMPTNPYADPSGYYGIPLVPPQEEPGEKKADEPYQK